MLEIVQAILEVWPRHYPLFTRISATDWADEGWNPDEAVQLSKILKQEGVDLIDCSSGGLIPGVKIPLGPGYQVLFSERIKKESGCRTAAVGLITDVHQVEQILKKEQADLVILGREYLRQPYFVLNAARELDIDVEWPLQYGRAKTESK